MDANELTPEAVAKKLCSCPCHGEEYGCGNCCPWNVTEIADALRAAEARGRAADRIALGQEFCRGYDAGMRQGLLRAAEIAQSFCAGDVTDCNCDVAAFYRAIRAEADKLEGAKNPLVAAWNRYIARECV